MPPDILTFVSNNIWSCLGFIALILIYIIFELTQKKHQAKTLSPQAAIQHTTRNKGIFLDIRGEKAYNESHIVGSIQTNVENLKQSVKFLQKYKNKPIIVYCNNGQSSKLAFETLKAQDFEDVSILRGGFSQWKSDNLPIERTEHVQKLPKKKAKKSIVKQPDHQQAQNDSIQSSETSMKTNESKVEIYTKDTCPFCVKAKVLLDSKKINYTSYDIIKQPELRNEMIKRANGRTTVPEIFINDKLIGGCDELYALENQGELDKLIL